MSGIQHVTPSDVAAALANGRKLRLVAGAEVRREGSEGGEDKEGGEGGGAAGVVVGAVGRPAGYVRVEALSPGDPLYGLDGADAALTLYTDRLAPVTITQSGSVVEDTAFGAYADMLRACRPMAV